MWATSLRVCLQRCFAALMAVAAAHNSAAAQRRGTAAAGSTAPDSSPLARPPVAGAEGREMLLASSGKHTDVAVSFAPAAGGLR